MQIRGLALYEVPSTSEPIQKPPDRQNIYIDVRLDGAGLVPVYTTSTLLCQEPWFAISLGPTEKLDTGPWKGASLAQTGLSCTLLKA